MGDSALALKTYAREHDMYTVAELLPEARRQLAQAEALVRAQMQRNVFILFDERARMNLPLSTSHPRWAPYFFIAPFVLIFCTFMAYPLVQSMVLALQQTFGPKTAVFVGLQNFRDLFADGLFWLAMRNTFVFATASVVLQLPLSLGLAMVLNRPGLKGRAVFRLIFFSPSLVGMAFVAMMFALMFHERHGLVNAFLRAVIPHFPSNFPGCRAMSCWHCFWPLSG